MFRRVKKIITKTAVGNISAVFENMEYGIPSIFKKMAYHNVHCITFSKSDDLNCKISFRKKKILI